MKTNKELLDAIYAHFPDSEDKDETMSLLITDSIETAITYWNTHWPKVSNTKEYYGDNVWEDVKAGKSLEFGDAGDKGFLNLESILNALDTLKKTAGTVYNDIQDENWDAYSCDTFFQTAVFGEVVFG